MVDKRKIKVVDDIATEHEDLMAAIRSRQQELLDTIKSVRQATGLYVINHALLLEAELHIIKGFEQFFAAIKLNTLPE